jgi:very-short-patch-repair endonuclease
MSRFIPKYDWVAIKKYHDDGHTWAEICEKFGCCRDTLTEAVKKGRLNKTNRLRKYNWEEIKKFQKEGHTWDEIREKFGCGTGTLQRALKRGDIIHIGRSEAGKISNRLKPRIRSEEHKKNLSIALIKYQIENPGRAAWKKSYYANTMSYPEKYFYEMFIKEKIDLQFHREISCFQMDFYHEGRKICLEIDGEQHYQKKKIMASDARKETCLKESGWKLFRVRWSKYCKLFLVEKLLLVEKIKSLLTLPEEDLNRMDKELTDEFFKENKIPCGAIVEVYKKEPKVPSSSLESI